VSDALLFVVVAFGYKVYCSFAPIIYMSYPVSVALSCH